VLIGAHVRGGGSLIGALERGAAIRADAVQVFTQSPRAWKPTQYAPDVLAAYRSAQRDHPSVHVTFCHATYLINLATADPALYERSVDCLIANLSVARGMGASGLVLHVGSHKGAGLDDVLGQIAAALLRALDEADDPADAGAAPCPILLENAAGAGGTVGRSFDELSSIFDAADGNERLGLCIDTQHLWASGVDYSTPDAADAVLDEVATRIGLARLGCLHLNDSKVDLGANRDRHENLGEGTIGLDGLAALLGHPALNDVPALLEVPGEGDGPRRGDVTVARDVLAAGIKLRAARGAKASGRERRSTERTRTTKQKKGDA
jgi:deoxyribonuclease IV